MEVSDGKQYPSLCCYNRGSYCRDESVWIAVMEQTLTTCVWGVEDYLKLIGAVVAGVGSVVAVLSPFILNIIKAIKENTQVTQANTDDRAVKTIATNNQLAAIATKVEAPVVVPTAPTPASDTLLVDLLALARKYATPDATSATGGVTATMERPVPTESQRGN